MSMPIGEIRGLPSGLEAKLKGIGVTNADGLLAKCRTPEGRREVASLVGLEPKALLELANRADLSRIHGVAGAFSDLLENAGVDTVKELAGRVPENLHEKLRDLNAKQQVTARTPTLEQVKEWVAEAKKLPRMIEY